MHFTRFTWLDLSGPPLNPREIPASASARPECRFHAVVFCQGDSIDFCPPTRSRRPTDSPATQMWVWPVDPRMDDKVMLESLCEERLWKEDRMILSSFHSTNPQQNAWEHSRPCSHSDQKHGKLNIGPSKSLCTIVNVSLGAVGRRASRDFRIENDLFSL